MLTILQSDMGSGSDIGTEAGQEQAWLAFKWYGGVLGPDGRVYGIPYSADAVLVITDHKAVDYRLVERAASLIVDTRGVYGKERRAGAAPAGATIVRA